MVANSQNVDAMAYQISVAGNQQQQESASDGIAQLEQQVGSLSRRLGNQEYLLAVQAKVDDRTAGDAVKSDRKIEVDKCRWYTERYPRRIQLKVARL